MDKTPSSTLEISEKFENESEDDQDLVATQCEVYSNYKPVNLSVGVDHPQQLTEGSGLSCVNPPKITYKLRLRSKYYKARNGKEALLSNAQLEAIVYACQSHDRFQDAGPNQSVRLGFYLGDGTGTGKTRTLAAIIKENSYSTNDAGLKAVWITVSEGLFEGVEAELKKFLKRYTILKVQDLPKPAPEYSSKHSSSRKKKVSILLLTYKSLTTKEKFKKICDWIGTGFDGIIIFDEAHSAKAAEDTNKRSSTGIAVNKLQDDYPHARVIYSSATGASEPHHLLYMKRLMLWGKGTEYESTVEFSKKLGSRGVAAMELLAMEMKQRGMFVSRQISFEGVKVIETEAPVNPTFEAVYDRSCQMWSVCNKYLHLLIHQSRSGAGADLSAHTSLTKEMGTFYAQALQFFGSWIMSSKMSAAASLARDALKRDKSVIIGLQTTGDGKFEFFEKDPWLAGQPYSYQMFILRHILLGMGVKIGCPKVYLKDGNIIKLGNWTDDDEETADKLPEAAWKLSCIRDEQKEETRKPKHHKDPVASSSISNQDEPPKKKQKMDGKTSVKQDSTVRKLDQKKVGEGSKGRAPVYSFTEKFWPNFSVGWFLSKKHAFLSDPSILSWSFDKVKSNPTAEGLARLYHELALFLPINPLDEITYRLEVGRDSIKEPTYKIAELTGRSNRYLFSEKTQMFERNKKGDNKQEMRSFMDKTYRVCVISSAASTGFSLHADKNCKNQQKRRHIVVQYSWGPDQMSQQLGRSHRSNQVVQPEYVIINSPIPGEVRHISVIAKRLRQLGAICNGQSLANPLTEKISDILCSKMGVKAINNAIKQLHEEDPGTVEIMEAVGCKSIESGEKKKSYFTKTTEKEVSTCFNRNLMLPLWLQRRFMNLIFKQLEALKAVERQPYSPIVELPSGTTTIKLVKEQRLNGKDGECVLLNFRVSRIATWEWISDLYQNHKDSSGFYVQGLHNVMFAINAGPEEHDVYFPYNKNPKKMSTEELSGWTAEEWNRAYSTWSSTVKMMEKQPGCLHSAMGISCFRGCTYKWGIYEILIVSGSTSQILSTIENRDECPFRIARVKFCKGKKQQVCVGLLIENPEIAAVTKAIELKLTQS